MARVPGQGKAKRRTGGKGFAVVIKRPVSKSIGKPGEKPAVGRSKSAAWLGALALSLGAVLTVALVEFNAAYTVSLQSPFQIRLQWPLVVAHRTETPAAAEAQSDQRHALTAYQQYACTKFGPACRVALAIQRAENPEGKCETYHHNSNGTLDWGYFQVNTIHLKRAGLNLRDLLDCKANIDFAYQLYREKGDFTPWSTFNNGAYRRYLHE